MVIDFAIALNNRYWLKFFAARTKYIFLQLRCQIYHEKYKIAWKYRGNWIKDILLGSVVQTLVHGLIAHDETHHVVWAVAVLLAIAVVKCIYIKKKN